MAVVKCDVPSCSVLDRRWVEAATFRDSYRVPLRDPQASLVPIFFALFGHLPWWMKSVLLLRNRLAAWCGLAVPTVAEVMHVQMQTRYRVGDTIGPWPIYSQTEGELVVGRNNKHLDFRLSIIKSTDEPLAAVTVSTVCAVHNGFGRLYLFVVVPFHEWGVKRLMSNAVAARRL